MEHFLLFSIISTAITLLSIFAANAEEAPEEDSEAASDDTPETKVGEGAEVKNENFIKQFFNFKQPATGLLAMAY